MLRIGDTHIKRNKAESIITELTAYIQRFPQEQHIVFFGDYVYHFQYDRKALLQLFHFFLTLYNQGKHIYVLAGNHDRIHNHFIYEEAQYAFAATIHGDGSIQFITEPAVHTIEGQDCLFFPYSPFLRVDPENNTINTFKDLLTSEHIGEHLSGVANTLLLSHIQQRRDTSGGSERLCVFHHRYIAQTTFPGQKTTFSYKNHALSPTFADIKDIMLVSGHIHHPFMRKNYLCIGSVWSPSPLEINQMKFLFRWNTETQTITAEPIEINPYIRIAASDVSFIDLSYLEEHRKQIYTASCHHLSSGDAAISFMPLDEKYPLANTTISIEHDTLGYDELTSLVSEDVCIHSVQVLLKRKKKKHAVSSEDLSLVTDTLDTSIANWKDLLKLYMQKKRKDDAPTYLSLLEELNILN